jgi:hypothetical protein
MDVGVRVLVIAWKKEDCRGQWRRCKGIMQGVNDMYIADPYQRIIVRHK